MARTLIITNDFPPRIGGIESFVADICELLDREVVVYASGPPDAEVTDRERGYPVIRAGRLLLPTRKVAATARDLLHRHGATRVIFGAAAPLGLLAPRLRAAGATRIVGLTHGHETWWATVPGARRRLRAIGEACDHLTVVSDYTRSRITPALSATARARLLTLAPPVDLVAFQPGPVRADHDRPQAVAVGRLVAQKGFDTLLHAWSGVLRRWSGPTPAPALTLVGDGPERRRLQTMIANRELADSVSITGALPRAGVVGTLQRADVFALPMRTRLGGLNPEGLGLAALEAAACGLPVIVGDSGGAPESLRPGETGFVVASDDRDALADRLLLLLSDRALARRMGAAGRAFVARRFSAERGRATLLEALG